MRRLILLLFLLGFGLAALVACTAPSEEEKALQFDRAGERISSQRKTLEIPILREDWSRLDPAYNTSYALRAIGHQLYVGLTAVSPEGQLRYLLAEEILPDARETVWTIHLSPHGTWSDGSPVTADDFVETWLSRLAPDSQCPVAYQAYMIKGARAYHEGQGAREEVGIAVAGEQIVVTLDQPYAHFPTWLSQDFFLPYKEHDGKPLYNGPYRLNTFDQKSIELVIQEEYWQKNPMGIKTIHFNFFDDDIMAYESYARGEQDLLGLPFLDIPYPRRESARRRPDCVDFPLAGISYIIWNSDSPFLGDADARSLLYAALDVPFLPRAIRYDQSAALFGQEAPTSTERKELMERFTPLREQYATELSEPLQVLAEGTYLSYREMVAEAKQWLDLYKLKVQVWQENRLPEGRTPDLIYRTTLYGTPDARDLFWFLSGQGALAHAGASSPDGSYPEDFEAWAKELNFLPLFEVHWINLVQAHIEGYLMPPNGMPQLAELSLR